MTSTAPRFTPAVSRTLVETVAEQLRDSILSGQLAPGERLVEAELARELGISRGPVREALAVLEKDGIVVSIPRRGKFLSAFDGQTISEIYSLRKVIEPYAIELLIKSIDDEKVAALTESFESIRTSAESGDVLDLAQRDIDFHNRIYELAEHRLLHKVWTEAIAGKLRMLLNVTVRTHPLPTTVDNHRIIVDAIISKNVRNAKRLIVAHIDDAWQRVGVALEKNTPTD